MSSQVRILTFKIDDRDVSAREGETILEVARENGIYIPTLCHLEGLSSTGACRLCIVEIAGRPKLFPACVTRAEEGIQVITQSERLTKYRRVILELIFSERNHTYYIIYFSGETLTIIYYYWLTTLENNLRLKLINILGSTSVPTK